MNIIRKISVGTNFPDGVLHYQTGKVIRLNGNEFTIYEIRGVYINDEKTDYEVYLHDERGVVLWKTISGMPVMVEYNIDFE